MWVFCAVATGDVFQLWCDFPYKLQACYVIDAASRQWLGDVKYIVFLLIQKRK